MVVLEVNVACLGERQQCRNLISMLPFFASLGVEVLYLLPIQKKGKRKAKGSPYCIADYWELDEAWGTEEDWHQLIESCQKYQMKCVLDWVMNHTAWDHPWVQDFPERYRKSKDGQLQHPPNTEWEDVVQLDVLHPALIADVKALMLRWMQERGIHGFRWDAMKRIPREVRMEIQQHLGDEVLWLGDGDTLSVEEEGVDFMERKWNPHVDSFSDHPAQWTFLHHHDEAVQGPSWKQKIASLPSLSIAEIEYWRRRWNNPVISLSMWSKTEELFSWVNPHWVKIPE